VVVARHEAIGWSIEDDCTARERPGEKEAPGIPSGQVMAIMRLTQWTFERVQFRLGRTTNI
jgi:hypothetical protein